MTTSNDASKRSVLYELRVALRLKGPLKVLNTLCRDFFKPRSEKIATRETEAPTEATDPVEKLATRSVAEGTEEHHGYGGAHCWVLSD